jgi:putative restriction endonuclease
MPLSRVELEYLVLSSLNLGDDKFIELSARGIKPIRVASQKAGVTDRFALYAWNITHGGATRSADEYRIQITGAAPASSAGEQALILGWSETFEVFAAWDPAAHLNRNSTSPSLQIHRNTLEAAYDRGIAAETRGSGDVVIAFQPGLLSTYAYVAGSLHSENAANLTADLNRIPDPSSVVPSPRTRTSQVVESYFRAWDFSKRVLGAYDHSCAVCGIQLGLIEAAHIVPVATPSSTDETRNGIGLCRIHHRAYDALLIDIATDLTVRVSHSKLALLRSLGRSEGELSLQALDGQPLLVIPLDPADRPYGPFLEEGSRVRAWTA